MHLRLGEVHGSIPAQAGEPRGCPSQPAVRFGSQRALWERRTERPLLRQAAELPHVGCDALVDHALLRRLGPELACEGGRRVDHDEPRSVVAGPAPGH